MDTKQITHQYLLEAFWSWVEINKGEVLPKSKLYQAMAYAQNQKKELENYLEDGNCNISNNLAENSIRPFTIGRKNWLFSGSPKEAEASAAVYSIISSKLQIGLRNAAMFVLFILAAFFCTPSYWSLTIIEPFF